MEIVCGWEASADQVPNVNFGGKGYFIKFDEFIRNECYEGKHN